MAQFGDFTVDRNSTKYVLGSGGTIISYATDEPAFEFNADGSYKGLLVEPAATNLITYSEEFDNAAWVEVSIGSGSVTITANAGTSPDGTSTADRVILNLNGGTTTGDIALLRQANTTTGSLTFSIYLKSFDGVSSYTMQLIHPDGSGVNITVTGSWQRFEVTGTSVGNVNYGIRLRGAQSPANSDSADVLVWGAQLETGPIATSYIPTTTASVTRVKDDITLGSASSLIGQTEGTLYIEVDWRGTSGTGQTLLDVTDGTSDNRVLIYNTSLNALNMFASANGAVLTSQGPPSSAYSGIQKLAFAYADNDFELYRNGSSISSDTSGSLAALATMTDIDLGQNIIAGGQANMHIRAVALYPTRLSDAECEALTTL